MRPRPPIRWGLTPEEEIAAFARLKPRLAELWSTVFTRDDEPYTSVVVPSVSVEADELTRHPGTTFYEETLLLLLIRLRNPRARIVYLTSQPIPPVVMDYYLHFLEGIPASHAAMRLTLLSAHDGSPRPLTRKILERPRLVERIRAAIPDLDRAYMTVYRNTELERRLAVLLDIPINAAEPGLDALCTKSSGRRILREAGIEVPFGLEGLRDEADLLAALTQLGCARPAARRAIVKLETSYWDEGHAVVTLPAPPASSGSLRRALHDLHTSAGDGDPTAYLARFARRGGVVEEFVEGVDTVVSAQARINPLGEVFVTSTHDERRGGETGLCATGCSFPASEPYRARIQGAAVEVGRRLAERGLASRISVEFLASRDADGTVRLLGSEINLGVGGATHPLLAVRFLTGGTLDPETGLFHSPSGRALYYQATDALASDDYRRLTPEDVIEVLTLGHLNYSPHGETGALFYMLGAIAELGRVGMVAVAHTPDEATALFGRTKETLDRASSPA